MNVDVVDAFDRASHYDHAARVQAYAAARLADRIASAPPHATARILEVGCGTGLLSVALLDRLPGRHWLLTDIAPQMLARCTDRIGQRPDVAYAILDGERPAADGRFDLICSSFTFQWFHNLAGAITGLRGLLAPGGRLIFATMADGSLREWDTAHRNATGIGAAMGGYPTAAELRALGATVEIEPYVEQHADAATFLSGLRMIGARRPRDPRPPLPAPALRRAMMAFERGGARITYMIAYGVIAA